MRVSMIIKATNGLIHKDVAVNDHHTGKRTKVNFLTGAAR